MTYYRLKVVFFVLLNFSVPALVAAMVSFGSGDHVCTTGNGASGTCQEKHVEIYPRSDFSLDCAENFACEDSTIVVGSGSTFTGDFVCGADGRPSFDGCKNADITFYDTDVSTYKVSCQYSGGTANSCQQTAFTMVDTNAEIVCDADECQDMVIHVCGKSHVHVSGSLDAGNPIDVNLYGDDATLAVDETGAYTISHFAAEQCPVARFSCNDGCMVFANYVGDGVCDCSDECEDEEMFECMDCSGGCARKCGERNQCSDFVCGDGCIISEDFVDDGFCDCLNCADESSYDCDSCECPDTCGDFFECFPTTTTLVPTTTTSKPTTTTLTPTTTTPKPTTTTTRPTTTSKPTTTTLKPTTTTLKPTTTTAKPTSTTRKPSTTALKPTTTEETTEEPGTGEPVTSEPVTSDIENTAEPQTSKQLIDWTTTDEVSDSGNDKDNSALETLEWVLMSVGFCAIVICVAFFVERKWHKKQKTKEVKIAVEKPSVVELKVDTLTTVVPKKVEVAGMCHVSAAPPRLAVELKLGVCHDTQDTANTAQSTEQTEVPHTDSEVAIKVKAEHLDLGHERNTTRGTTDGEDGEWEIDEDKYEELEDFWGL